MTMVSNDFGYIATTVTERAAELLCARVSVVDDHGMVVANSDQHSVGRPVAYGGQEPESSYLRVPLRLAGQSAEVLVMAVTSALIPPLCVYWRLRGAVRFRVLFL